MGDQKTKPGSSGDVSAFVDGLEDGSRQADARALIVLMSRITGQDAILWGSSLIGFGTYHYRYESGREGDYFRVGFSPRKANLVIYLPGGLDGYSEDLGRLGKHTTGQSCIYIKKLGDIDLAVLEALIARSFGDMAARYPI